MLLVQKYLSTAYEAVKERMVDSDNPELRGEAKALRGLLKTFQKAEQTARIRDVSALNY